LAVREASLFCSVDLSSSSQVVAGKQAVPGFEPVLALDWTSERIGAGPRFSRRPGGEVLMRPDMVIEETELRERAVERFERVDGEPVEPFFQRAEEAFDTPFCQGQPGSVLW
jgi:hypothetical protein